ncbi:MAG: hypothetical protein M3O36_18250, partial [Myxococcota bacterium]|nr:hypothetical protein [Myxococcota bacterium]
MNRRVDRVSRWTGGNSATGATGAMGTGARRRADVGAADDVGARARGESGGVATDHAPAAPPVEEHIDRRVLVHAPLGRDADLVSSVLAGHRIEAHPCA